MINPSFFRKSRHGGPILPRFWKYMEIQQNVRWDICVDCFASRAISHIIIWQNHMFFKCCLFIFQKGTLWRAGKRNGHIWVKCWINILLLSFLLSFLFSFLASSSRPLETLKLWFLPSRPLPEGGWQKIYIYIVCFFSFFSTPPSDPERLLLPRDLKT